MYLVKSSTTATLQHCPARLVPAPRGRTGSAVFPARGHRGDHIVVIARNDQADGNLPVIRAVGCIQRAAAAIEAHFAFHDALQFVLKFGCLGKRVNGLAMRTERQWRQSRNDVL